MVNGSSSAFARALAGRRIERAGRRGKNVVIRLERSERLVVNLGMTGRLAVSSRHGPAPAATHPAVVFDLASGSSLTYDDVRRFGRLSWMARGEWTRWSRSLGPEPLARTFTGERMAAVLARSRSPVRSLLLDQKRIAGVGNIYAVEALWGARIHPRTPSADIGAAAVRRLHRSLRRVLRRAVEAGGTTLRNYRAPDGAEGRFRRALHAYGREGRPCTRCRTPIERLVFGGRSAFVCPRCQPGRLAEPASGRAGAGDIVQ